MKKMRIIAVVLSMLLVFSLSTCLVSAADGDLLRTWAGTDLTGRTTGADQGGERDAEKGVVHLGTTDVGSGHALWGYETDSYETAGATKSFTSVIKVKIVEEGEDCIENVIRVDHHLVGGAADSGDYYSGERLCEMVPAADGYLYLYSVIDSERYEEADSVKVENRVWFDNGYGWVIDVYEVSLYEGDLSEQFEAMCTPEATPTPEPTPTPEATETPATEAPATDVPATEAPATTAPATEAPATTDDGNVSTPNDGEFPIWIVIVIVAVVVVAVIVVVIVAKKKK